MTIKYRYTGGTPGSTPAQGEVGSAWPSRGSADPFSIEYGAWLFEPDEPSQVDVEDCGGSPAYYVSDDELEEVA